MRVLVLLLAGCLGWCACNAQPEHAHAQEWHARNGLPAASQWLADGGEFRVAYLGGSITAADGWRRLTTEHFRALRPKDTVIEIAAGLPGTGSDLGVCRLEADVLRHRPNLLFVEFAVNDSNTAPAEVERTIEGIVRKTWRADPDTDICFVYTVSTPGLSALMSGEMPPTALAMEKVAAHYGIPSVHFGFEVARRVTTGTLVFKGTESDGGRAFSLDGVHPTSAGHQLYADVLQRALRSFREAATGRPALPAPLHADNWERAEQRELSAEILRGEWKRVPMDDPFLRGAIKPLLPPLWRADEPGAFVEFEFTGTRLGLLGIAAPDSGEFIVTVDDEPPVTDTFFDSYVTASFCRARKWFYPRELAPGRHRVRIELSARPVDKAAIKRAAGRPFEPAPEYDLQRLTLGALLLVDTAP